MFRWSEPIPVVGAAPDAAPTTCIEISEAWIPLLIGLAEFMLWPGFWAGSQPEIDLAETHAQQLIGVLVGSECALIRQACLYHQTADHAGSAIAGWQTRPLNTKHDNFNLVELSDNLFTPLRGIYAVHAVAPVHSVGKHQLRLWNVTQGYSAILGVSAWTRTESTTNPTQNNAVLMGTLYATGSDVFALHHYCQNAVSGWGLGADAHSGEDNVYAKICLLRLAPDYPME